MRQANATSHEQLQSIKNNERHAKRDLFTSLAGLQIKQLEALAKEIIQRLEDPRYKAFVGDHRGSGHEDINLLLLQSAKHLICIKEEFTQVQHRKNTINTSKEDIKQYLTTYDGLLDQAQEYDDQGELIKLFKQSAYEKFYQAIVTVASSVLGTDFHSAR